MNNPDPIPDDEHGNTTQGEPGANTDSMPFNTEAEMALLGALFMKNDVYERICDIVKPEHFAHPEHGRIYQICSDQINSGGAADSVFVMHNLKPEDGVEPDHIANIQASAVTTMNAPEYARIIRELYLRRELILLGREVEGRAREEENGVEIIEEAERHLSELAGDSVTENAKTRTELANQTLQVLEQRYIDPHKLTGLSTGIQTLDKIIMGIEAPQLIILAGRPGMGKTALAQLFAKYNAKKHHETDGAEGAPVGFWSLEMSADELNTRFISDEANIPIGTMRSGLYDQMNRKEQWAKVVDHSQRLANFPLYVDDRGGASAMAIRARARRMKRRHGLGMVIIDQLSHIVADPRLKRHEALGQITKDMKQMAKELEVPVILLHQLNRSVEMRDDKRPQLSDLRDSGEIEQDADVVLFAYREQYYLERTEPAQHANEKIEAFNGRQELWRERLKQVTNRAEIIVAKQRMGGIGRAKAYFEGKFTRFSDVDERQEDFI